MTMMLTAEGCTTRRNRLWAALTDPCEVVVVGDPTYLTYFAGYTDSPFLFRSVEAGALLLLTPDRSILVGDNLLRPFLDRAFVDEVVAPTWYDGRRPTADRRRQLVSSALEQLATLPAGPIGVDLAGAPAGVLEGLRGTRPDAQIRDIGPVLRPLRRSKDPDELAALRASMRAGEAAHAAALRRVEPGMTELDAFAIVQKAANDSLGEPALVYGDFASGPRTVGGGSPTSRRIGPGELLLLDFSVVASGYRGDFTNTFAVGAPPSVRQRERFEAILGALRAAESRLRAGTPARDIDAAIRGHFASLGLESDFRTHSGHGLGLGHPEPPYFVPESDEVLQAGDVVAVEPGLYLPDEYGMRYERNYFITQDGYECLSNHELRLEP